jgi:hypothetical protein
MKPTCTTIASSAVALLCLTLGNSLRAQADDPAGATKPEVRPAEANLSSETKSESISTEGQPTKFNKASSFIGMEVRNQNDERLGTIRELVFDPKSERMSYAVMATGGIAGFSPKLMAIPVSAFSPGPDEKHLVLHAEKSKIESAMGFTHEKWPSVANPSWGAEPFWQKDADASGIVRDPALPLIDNPDDDDTDD